MKFFIASPWKNKSEVERLSESLEQMGHSAYSFVESGSNLLTGQPIQDEMREFTEALMQWKEDDRIAKIAESEVQAIRDADVVILLLPAGDSSHLEAGIGYGLGKRMVLIGPVAKPEIVYVLFNHVYLDVSSFIKDFSFM
jgi:nucleoside 2-deoxyribosyltransferase